MMTGRELIIYILENHLEDADTFNYGQFIGFITEEELASDFNVRLATVRAWYTSGSIKGFYGLNQKLYFLSNTKDPRKE